MFLKGKGLFCHNGPDLLELYDWYGYTRDHMAQGIREVNLTKNDPCGACIYIFINSIVRNDKFTFLYDLLVSTVLIGQKVFYSNNCT